MATVLIPSGICHCGHDMAGHPVWDNHSPVEMMKEVQVPAESPAIPTIPTIEVLASVRIGNDEVHMKLLLSVPPAQKYRDLHGTSRKSVERLFAEMAPLVSSKLAEQLEQTPGGQFQGS